MCAAWPFSARLATLRNGTVDSRGRRNPPHFEAPLTLHCLAQVIVHLHGEPQFRAAAKGFVQADRHLRRDTALAVDEIVERLPRHAEHLGSFGYTQAKRFEAIVAHG